MDLSSSDDQQADADVRINRIIADAISLAPEPPPPAPSDIREAIDRAIKSLERTVFCRPEIEDQVREVIGINQIHGVTVVGNPYLPEDKIYIVPTHIFNVDPEEALRPVRKVVDMGPVIRKPAHAIKVMDL